MGNIGANNSSKKKTIEDSKEIRDDLKSLGKALGDLQNVMLGGLERGPGGNSFLLNDEKLTEELKASDFYVKLAKGELTNPELAYGANLHNMSEGLAKDLLAVYMETTVLYTDIKEHIRQSEASASVLKTGLERVKKFNPFGYAGHLRVPTADAAQKGEVPTVRIVQLGSMYCSADAKEPSPQGCGSAPPAAFQTRTDEQSPGWVKRTLTTEEDGKLTAKRLIKLDAGTKVFQQLIQGGEAFVYQVDYMKRIKAIQKRLKDVIALRKNVEQRLENKSRESKKFSFFM